MGSIYPLELLLDKKDFVDITLSSATSCSSLLIPGHIKNTLVSTSSIWALY